MDTQGSTPASAPSAGSGAQGAAGAADGMREVKDSILDMIGETPLVRLRSIGADLAPSILVKVEFFNPGGSVKDRIGVSILDAYEREGRLKPGGTVVEATSGNTGVGLAIAAALRGYHSIFVMPDKMSDEKIRLLRAFGSRVVITPTAVEPDDPRSYYSVARRLVEETPGAVLANQYHNPANPEAHYRTTGPEVWRQTDGRVTHFICCLGTGGTISGVGRFLKERRASIQIVGVDPVGSVLHDYFYTGVMPPAQSYKVEGIGEDFLPSTTDFGVVDDVVQVTDGESFRMARRLVREEGMFVGGSCGSALAGALDYVRERGLGPDDVVVVLLPDSGSRYLSKLFDDDWMRENGFLTAGRISGYVSDILTARGRREVISVPPEAAPRDVVALMKANGISELPVLGADGSVLGIVREIDLLTHMLDAPGPAVTDPGDALSAAEPTISPMISNRIAVVQPGTSLAVLGKIFGDTGLVVVSDSGQVTDVLTKIDLIEYLTDTMEGRG